jgi:RimJ/RimL family protein N-acetyltransferase
MVALSHQYAHMTATLIYGQEERLLPWAAARSGASGFRRDAYSIGLERDGELCAVVAFDDFTDCNVNMHIASDGTRRWMNKELLVAAFSYPFVQLGLRRVTGLVPAGNAQALAFDEHLGFVREGLCRHGFVDDDMVVLGMLRSECRFIPKEFRR